MQSFEKNIYNLHHLLDPINIAVCSKVLKMSCFNESRKRFDIDFVNDTGIINLLRKEYLKKGSIIPVFELYQGSRLDEYSHRYESLLAMQLLAIVGNVVAGVLLSVYMISKNKIIDKIKQKNNLFGREIKPDEVNKILEQIKKGLVTEESINKYFSKQKEIMLEDFKILTKCYIAQKMFDGDIISRKEYDTLTRYFLKRQEKKILVNCLRRYKEYEINYISNKGSIIPDKVMLAVDGYAKGIVSTVIEEEQNRMIGPENELIVYLYGLAAAPGFGQGILVKHGNINVVKQDKHILLIDANQYTPDEMDEIRDSEAVITYKCGMTGHLPLACRALCKGCVILEEKETLQLKEGIMIAVSGHQGIVAIGKLVM